MVPRIVGWSSRRPSKRARGDEEAGLRLSVLALAARRIAEDWRARYGYRPVVLETFVESPRHKRTCYKAANWELVGRTADRGKKGAGHEQVWP